MGKQLLVVSCQLLIVSCNIMKLSFKSTQRKIALLFAFTSSILILLTTLLIIFITNIRIDNEAKDSLYKSLEDTIEDFDTGDIENKNISFQSRNLTESEISDEDQYDSSPSKVEKKLPNIEEEKEKVVQKDESTEKEMSEEFQKLQKDSSVYSRVILSNGDILYSSDLFDSFFIDPDQKGFKKSIKYETCIYSVTSQISEGENAGSIVQVAQYCTFTPKQQKEIIMQMLVVTGMMSVITYIFGLLVAKLLLNPLQKSVNQTHQFIQNCYHELLTPLTVASTSIEAAIASNKHKKGLLSVQEDLGESIKALEVLSSQASLKQSRTMEEKINVYDVLEEVSDLYSSKLKTKNLKLKEQDIDKKVTKECNPSSLKIIFKNLLNNAIRYSKPESEILLSLSNDSFEIINEIGDPRQVNVSKFFDRTYRGENSHDGKGIGLSITKDLVESNGWKISAELENNFVKIRIEF